MKIGHSRPVGGIWSLSGTGAAFLTSTANLADGRPDTVDRLQWLSGAQSTSSVLRLRCEFDDAIVPGMVGISNCSLPVGTLIRARYRRASDPVGTYPYNPAAQNEGQRLIQGVRGERTWWVVLNPGATPVKGVEYQFENNVGGSAVIPASSTFELGDVIIVATDEVVIDKDWSDEWVDPTVTDFSWSRQPYSKPGTPYRVLNFQLPLRHQKKYFGDATAPSLLDYEELVAKLDRGQRCVYVPRWQNPDGTFAEGLLHRTARIGIATKLPKFNHRAGPNFDSTAFTVIESPIPV